MSGTDDGTTGPGARDAESAWSDWIRPQAAVLGVAAVAAAALARTVTGPSVQDAADDATAGADAEGTYDDAWEKISRDTQQVADHGVTLAAMNGVAQAQADTIESFDPSNY